MEKAGMGANVGLVSDKKPILVNNPVTYDEYRLLFITLFVHIAYSCPLGAALLKVSTVVRYNTESLHRKKSHPSSSGIRDTRRGSETLNGYLAGPKRVCKEAEARENSALMRTARQYAGPLRKVNT
jgi:hypothetical protein